MKKSKVNIQITGPRGSGKTLVLLAMTDFLSKLGATKLSHDKEKHIISFVSLPEDSKNLLASTHIKAVVLTK
jgi:hypothetical protein